MGFVAVLLTILKILGIVVGSILALILLILALVLFVPIRYRAQADYHDDVIIKARASYLLHILTAKCSFIDKKFEYKITVFGIPLSFGKKKEKKKKEKKKKQPDTQSNNLTDSNLIRETEIDAHTSNEQISLEKAEKSFEESTCHSQNTSSNQRSYSEPTEDKKGIFKRIKDRYNDIKSKFIAAKRKVKELLHKKDELVAMYEDPQNREALRMVLSGLGKILKHIMPRKYRIHAHFGMEDPATTGEILGGAYAAAALLGLRLDLEPDFEQKIIEADGYCIGRIRIFSILIVVWKIYRNKRIKALIHKFL